MMISWMTAVILVAMLVGYIELKFETQEMRKEIYKKAEGKAQDCSEFMELAESITGYLVDKEWAKKIYKKAEKKAEEIF